MFGVWSFLHGILPATTGFELGFALIHRSFPQWDGRSFSGFMRKKILVVEDDTDLLEIMRLSLKGAGYSIATATNGIEALKKARTLSPDLILLDLVLPELDGFAVCETLRRDRATAEVPIIVVTGLSSEFTRLAGLESGATDYVTKPVSPMALVSKIDALLKGTARPTPAAESEKRSRASTCVHS